MASTSCSVGHYQPDRHAADPAVQIGAIEDDELARRALGYAIRNYAFTGGTGAVAQVSQLAIDFFLE